MVRQVRLVAVDADHVLQAPRQPGLLVRLELRQVEHHVGLDRLAGDQVLVPARACAPGRGSYIVTRNGVASPVIGSRSLCPAKSNST